MQSAFSWAPKLARKCENKHWYACGADGRAAGRQAVYGHVITKFSGMGRFTYPWRYATVCMFKFFMAILIGMHLYTWQIDGEAGKKRPISIYQKSYLGE